MALMEQLPLFLDQNMLLNTADADLVALRLEDSLTGYRAYEDLYGENPEVKRKRNLAEFLFSGMACPSFDEKDGLDHQCLFWDAVETHAQTLGLKTESLLSDIRGSFFQRIAECLSQFHAEDLVRVGNVFPAGYVYLQTGNYEKAVALLRAQIATSPNHARIWGYLGDAFFLNGSLHAAGQSYFQAFLVNPAAVDWRHLRHRELLSLRRELMEESADPEKPDLVWLPVHAYLRKMIFPRPINQKQILAELARRYLEYEKAYLTNPQEETGARIFLVGIVLCQYEPLLWQIQGVDLASIRLQMKNIHPEIFQVYLQTIANK